MNSVQSTNLLDESIEKNVITAVLNQRNLEQDFAQKHCAEQRLTSNVSQETSIPNAMENGKAFQQCRRLFNELGLASWEQRPSVHLVKKNDKLLRELKNLVSENNHQVRKYFLKVFYFFSGLETVQRSSQNCGDLRWRRARR